jgi:hypothetical protein
MTYSTKSDQSPLVNMNHNITTLNLLRYQALLDHGASKGARIFRLLRDARRQWVSMPELGQAVRSRCVASAISDLRRQGCEIENKLAWGPFEGPGENRELHSWYRLLQEPKEAAEKLDSYA